MKRNIKLFSACFAFLFGCSALFCEEAVVTYVKGKVEVRRNNTWVVLKAGDSLKESDTVSTGFQSEAKIKYNGSLMSLGSLTRITLDELSSANGKDNVNVYLNTGAVRSRVTHTDAKKVDYRVRSAVAVASVRGTEFLMTSGGSVRCYEGAVVVYPNTEGRYTKKMAERMKQPEEWEGDRPEEEPEQAAPEEESEKEKKPEVYHPAKATSSPKSISEDAPAGAVVVGAHQKTEFDGLGKPGKPKDIADKEMNEAIDGIKTPAEKESEQEGPSVSKKADKGKVSVTISIEGN